jgi:glycosyltransferase A (GT-A) superfamily protein (DUF2064 family)
MDKVLIVFVKYPQAGRVKTRLAKEIGKIKAALLYKKLAEKIIKQTRCRDYQQVIFYTPKNKKKEIAGWLGKDLNYSSQQGRDLGQRIHKAFDLVFKQGAKRWL